MDHSLITYGGVPPGLAQWTFLPSAEALGLIIPDWAGISSSGLGGCAPLDRVLATGLHVDQRESGTFAFFRRLDSYDMLVILGAYFQFYLVAFVIALALELVRIL